VQWTDVAISARARYPPSSSFRIVAACPPCQFDCARFCATAGLVRVLFAFSQTRRRIHQLAHLQMGDEAIGASVRPL